MYSQLWPETFYLNPQQKKVIIIDPSVAFWHS